MHRWGLNGAYLGSVSLNGYGTQNDEASYPQNIRIVADGDYWLTYSGGVLSTWDMNGDRKHTDTLLGAGTSFDSMYSLSYANGMVFVVDRAHDEWRGYTYSDPSVATPEPSNFIFAGVAGLMGIGYAWRRRRTNPVA